MLIGTTIARILRVEPETHRIELEYDDGFRGVVDLGFLFRAPGDKPMVAEILRGDMFERCFVESGALAWPNGYELCPDALRGWINEVGAKVA